MPFLEEQRIRRFLAHYLGSAAAHVAFGGRADTIAMLCRWIESDEGPSFRFLVGPMGRGKSAVICRLLETIASSATPESGPGAETSATMTPEIVFVPVSLRFETNGAGTLLSAVDRLALLHGDGAPHDAGSDVRRTLLADYLARPLPDGRRLLVVIDGVDEAAGWTLDLGCLPRALSPRTRVLLSLRGTAVDAERIAARLELGRAAWHVDELDVLGVAGVVELLRHEGLPAVAFDSARMHRLCELSAGDPLVLRFLVDDLRTGDADAFFARAATPGFESGLRGVFARELERVAIQDDPATAAFLGVLACAHGPLGRDDLIAVAPTELPRGGTIDRTYQPLRRLVLHGASAYAFAHPGLAEHVRDHWLTRAERDRWQLALVAYGQRVVAALAAGERIKVSPWLQRSYGAHLETFGGSVEDLMALVQDGWRREWEAHQEGVSGFLGDVDRAWTAVARASRSAVASAGSPKLAALIRCALCPASVRSQMGNVAPRLLAALLERQIWSPAQALAHLRVGVERARDFSDQSLEDGLAIVAPHLDAGQALEAMDLAVALARRDHAPTIKPWLALLPYALPARLDDVELHARMLQRWQRFEALVEIARLVDVEVPAQAATIRAEAIQILRTEIPRPWGFLNLTTSLATELKEPARSEILGEACAIAEAVDPLASRASYCAKLARIVTGELHLHMAIVTARAGCAHPHDDGPGDALDLILDVEDDVARRVLDEIIAAGHGEGVARWLGRHWQPERVSVAQRWARIVELLDEGDLARVGEAWLERLRQRWHGSKDPTPLQDLVDAGLADEAIAIARESQEPRWCDVGLGHLAAMLPIDERIELLTRLLASGDAPEWVLESTIAAVADERPEVALSLLPRARAPIRARALARLAWCAAGAERVRLAVAAGAAAREIKDAYERLQLLDGAQRLSDSDELFRLVCDEIAALPARFDSLRRRYIQDLEDRCTPAQREMVERLTPGTDVPDEYILMPGVSDARLQRMGRAGLAAIRRSDLRAQAFLRLAALLAENGEQREADLAIEDALRSSRVISDTRAVCEAAASLRPREPTMTAIIGRARLIADPAERFQTLVAVLPHAGVAHETAKAAAIDAAEVSLDIRHVPSRIFFLRHAPPERRDVAVTRLFDEVRSRCREIAPLLSTMRTTDQNLDLSDANHFDRDQVGDLQRLLGEIAWALSPAQAEEALDLIPLRWTGHVLALLNVLARRDEAAYARRAPMLLGGLDLLRTQRGIARGGALAVLAHNVPSGERAAVIVEALAEARTEGDEHARDDNGSAVLQTLAPLLDDTHVDRILPLALGAWRESIDVHHFVSRLPEHLRGAVSERLFDAVKAVDTHEMLIAGLAAHLPVAALDRVIEAIERKARSHNAVLQVVPTLARRCRDAQLVRILDLAVEIDRRAASRPDASVRAIGSVGATLLAHSREHAPRIFDRVDEIVRAHARTRGDLLDAITALAPVLRELAGPDEMDALAGEILEVSRWWP